LARASGNTVGSYAISQGTLTATNYTISFTGNTLTITPAPLSVKADPQMKVYGAVDPVLTYQVSGLKLNDTPATALTGALVRLSGEKVGQYAIIQGTLKASPNYNITFMPATLTVMPAPLTMTVNSVSRYFGVDNPQFTVSFAGLVNNDKITASGITTATPTSPPGKYPITIPLSNIVDTGGRLSNYRFTNPTLPGGYGTNGMLSVVLTYAAYVTKVDCSALGFSGQSFTDSFDSSEGPYAKTHTNMRGDIAVNGNAELKDEAVINGSVYTASPATVGDCEQDGIDGIANGVTLSGDALANGSPEYEGNPPVPPYMPLSYGGTPGPVPFLTSPATPLRAGLSDLKVTSNKTLNPDGASPQYRDIVVNGKVTLTLNPGIYTINTLTLRGGATVVAKGPVILNIAGRNTHKRSDSNGDEDQNRNDNSGDQNQGDDGSDQMIKAVVFNGGSITTANAPSGSPNPADLVIVYWGAGEIDLAGQSHSYGVLYAPNAAIKLRNRYEWYGALVVNDLDVPERTAVHYDLNLGR
jgi:MBG domain (YGX type)